MSQASLLDLAGVAARMGLTYKTVRGYHGTAEHRRKYDSSRPGDMPPPDDHFGRSPVWRASTIDQWIAQRPGRGAGGGRPWPRKEPT